MKNTELRDSGCNLPTPKETPEKEPATRVQYFSEGIKDAGRHRRSLVGAGVIT
ncbi:hypothetical protein KKF34_04890 [Myxococcota bacterium]|nr:hypothetical protein [Myxococcota bacterium]MBU1382082.1 hypothetical protein [Myxococcota bacterium]MBU1496196.1 hypothetical protein [Myxococcota bacterium]